MICHSPFILAFLFHTREWIIFIPTTPSQFSYNIPVSLLASVLSSVKNLKGGGFFYSRMRTDLDANATSSIDDIPKLKFLDCSLRVCSIPLRAATMWLTVTNQQDNSSYGRLEFGNLMGLKYMVFISAICACYAFVAALSLWCKCFVAKPWLFFVSDQTVAYLMVTSGAAVLEILYLAYNGDREVTRSEACSSYGRFCSKMTAPSTLYSTSSIKNNFGLWHL
ncbi:hypothetical protein F2P56_005446 [Juglans regia]|uniref:CASP-like protein n=3 Tax=Juglans regia TaxID=51240 RepID=A0A2I4DX11_JUGRE|nr:CASP-like protein 2D1 isoform X1 [Juglans regia]KAF5478925.1 hypothetical protein F2P56_005446 [Juglans regia]